MRTIDRRVPGRRRTKEKNEQFDKSTICEVEEVRPLLSLGLGMAGTKTVICKSLRLPLLTPPLPARTVPLARVGALGCVPRMPARVPSSAQLLLPATIIS